MCPRENNKKITRKKFFCPICGSAAIIPVGQKFRCTNCKAIFDKPEKTEIKLNKRPRYIG